MESVQPLGRRKAKSSDVVVMLSSGDRLNKVQTPAQL